MFEKQILTILQFAIMIFVPINVTAQLQEAQAKLIYTKAFYKRQKALYDAKQLSQNLFEQYTQDYDVAKAKVKQLQASLELETKTYNNLFIKSPANGIVIARKVNLGQMITSMLDATVLFEIAKDLEKMEAHIDVDESDIGLIQEGQEAHFTVDAFLKQQFSAKVTRVQYNAKIVDNVVTYATILDVSNPELQLRPGMTANVEIKVAEALDAICIPNKALRISTALLETVAQKYKFTIVKAQENGKAGKGVRARDFIWTFENKKTIRQIEVQFGVNDGKFTQVINGLDANAELIVDVDEDLGGSAMLQKLFASPGSLGKK